MRILLTYMALEIGVAFGQGTVDFRNGGISFQYQVDRKVYFPDCTPLVGTSFVAGLYYLPGQDRGTELSDPTSGLLAYAGDAALATFRPLGTTSPGIWINPPEVGNYRVLEGVSVGQIATLQVRVWDITKFASYAEAVGGGSFYTASAPFNYRVPNVGPPPDHWYLNELRAFGCVPEPSTMILLLMAGSGLWFVRRRRS